MTLKRLNSIKKWNKEHKDSRSEINRRYYEKHKERIKSYQATYRKTKGKLIAY